MLLKEISSYVSIAYFLACCGSFSNACILPFLESVGYTGHPQQSSSLNITMFHFKLLEEVCRFVIHHPSHPTVDIHSILASQHSIQTRLPGEISEYLTVTQSTPLKTIRGMTSLRFGMSFLILQWSCTNRHIGPP
jgi:hypothetical protein